MKKRTIVKSALLASAVIFVSLLFDVASLGGLKEITRPYLGMYECERVLFGGEDKTEEFGPLKLELGPSGKAKLYYRCKNGEAGVSEAEYSYDASARTVTFYAEFMGRKAEKSFPLRDGKLQICLRYGGKMLVMDFVRR